MNDSKLLQESNLTAGSHAGRPTGASIPLRYVMCTRGYSLYRHSFLAFPGREEMFIWCRLYVEVARSKWPWPLQQTIWRSNWLKQQTSPV